MIVNGDLATMVAVIEFEILSFLVGRKIDLIYLYATILSLSLISSRFIIHLRFIDLDGIFTVSDPR